MAHRAVIVTSTTSYGTGYLPVHIVDEGLHRRSALLSDCVIYANDHLDDDQDDYNYQEH